MSMQLAKRGNLQTRFNRNIEYFHKIADEQKITIRKIEKSPIIPLLIGSEKKALEVSKKLLRQHYICASNTLSYCQEKRSTIKNIAKHSHSQEQIYELLNQIVKFLR